MASTQASTLAIRTSASRTLEEARQRVLRQYRAWQRAAPIIVQMYQLDVPVSTVRSALRNAYEKHRNVTYLKALDILIFQGHAEYQETLNFWKQPTHVMTLLQKHVLLDEEPKLQKKQPHNMFLSNPMKNDNLTKNFLTEKRQKRVNFLEEFLSGKS
ncbi:hypothetical protein PORY_000288 [Pneumocystis oryctolagi]|uniref:Uncharacterized protein n=1 Tax=Pneumocystis oryctolagi TaxID=42067 RepID=A0ACB7CFX5_9ASCO|nr:hypothetical protein PORY_000288 [Pneumocystis oryctolagi]